MCSRKKKPHHKFFAPQICVHRAYRLVNIYVYCCFFVIFDTPSTPLQVSFFFLIIFAIRFSFFLFFFFLIHRFCRRDVTPTRGWSERLASSSFRRTYPSVFSIYSFVSNTETFERITLDDG